MPSYTSSRRPRAGGSLLVVVAISVVLWVVLIAAGLELWRLLS